MMNIRRAAITIVCIAAATLTGARLVQAGPFGERLAKGVFLVATPKLHGSSFERTVILVTDYGPQGAMGIAINRPSGHPLSEFFPAFEDFQAAAPLFLGGPVRPLSLLVLAQPNPGDGWHHVIEDVFVGGGSSALTFLQERLRTNDTEFIRAYAGYAGWAPGQLEHEIERDDWLVVKSDHRIIFAPEQDETWGQMYRRSSGNWI